MPNYQNGKIYTIRCKTDDTLIYVGSTTQTYLSQRFQGHKADSLKIHQYPNHSLYTIAGDWNDWYIELYENFPCLSKDQLNKREGEIIRLIGTLNKQIAGRTNKEWRIENAEILKQKKKTYNENNKEEKVEKNKIYREKNHEAILEKKKDWYEKNKEKLKEEKLCECGATITGYYYSTHCKSKKHLLFMSSI